VINTCDVERRLWKSHMFSRARMDVDAASFSRISEILIALRTTHDAGNEFKPPSGGHEP
jgi:hypothetical protein